MNPAIVYRIDCLSNGKHYIGLTFQTLSARWNSHKSSARGSHSKQLIHKAMRKYGISNFTIRVESAVPSTHCARIIERSLIKNTRPAYNMTAGGEGANGLCKASRDRIGEKNRGRSPSSATRQKMSDSQKKADRSRHPRGIELGARVAKGFTCSKSVVSTYKGVYKTKSGKWKARVGSPGTVCSKTFKTVEEAATAYDSMAVARWGEGVPLNFPREVSLKWEELNKDPEKSRINRGFSSPFKGVSYHKATGKFAAILYVKNKCLHLGLFTDPCQANLVRQAKLLELSTNIE